MTPDPAIATAADYADAMIVARRAKNASILLLLLMLLAQLTFFFLIRYDVVHLDAFLSPTTSTSSTSVSVKDVMHYFSSGCMFAALILSIVLGFILLLIANIMLVGRLIGVARVTGAYIWSLLLLVLLFPWQAFLNSTGLTPDQATFKIPGVLITWEEMLGAKFVSSMSWETFLKWSRFVGFPLVAVIIVLIIQIKSNRGMRQALGEDELPPHELNV